MDSCRLLELLPMSFTITVAFTHFLGGLEIPSSVYNALVLLKNVTTKYILIVVLLYYCCTSFERSY